MHLEFVLAWLRDFGFEDFEADLSTRPEKYVGEIDRWDQAERELEAALQLAEIPSIYPHEIEVRRSEGCGISIVYEASRGCPSMRR